MPALSGGDLTLLRTHPHSIKEYLAVLQPPAVFSCLLDGVPASDPAISIEYDNVSFGAFGDVVVGMTLWVGSAAGGRDKGTCRIRKAAGATTLYIAEESLIDWVDNDHLTVVENYELWVKYPRVTVAGDVITFYKDWEETYSDQHEAWPPVAIMGPPDCQFIDGGLATVNFVGENSYAVAPGASLTGHAWVFPSGTPPNSAVEGTAAAPVVVTWDTAGTYWVTLTVTDDNGKTHVGRRPVFIFDRTGAGAPYTRFQITGRQAGLNQHGHTTSFKVEGDADQAEFPDGALVVYFTEDWYGSTKQSIGGTFPHRAHVKFVGYIQKESTMKDPESGEVTFDATTINALMATREGFSCWIKNTGNATIWCEATNLTADRAALSLCRHHSTLLTICDVVPSGDTEYIKSQEFAAKTTLLRQLTALYDDMFAHVACDKHGRVYFELDPQMMPVADRAAIATVAALGHGDWRENINLPRPQEPKTSFINLGGVYYQGHPHEVDPILSKAPGDAPAYGGSTREISGLILGGQADGNEKAGLALAYDNNEFPDVSLPMAGLWDVFDIVPQEYITFSLIASDTKRGIVWTNQKLIPRRISLNVEEADGDRVPSVDITVEKDSYGPSGVDGDYPDEVPPTDGDGDGVPPPPPPLPGPVAGDGNLIYFVDYTTGRPFRTRNGMAAAGDVIYEDLGVVDANGLTWIALDSWDPKNRAMGCGPDGVWLTENLDDPIPTWAKVLSVHDGSSYGYSMVVSSICQEDLWMTVEQWVHDGTGDKVQSYFTDDSGDTWTAGGSTSDATPSTRNKAKIQCSDHDALKAWFVWLHNTTEAKVRFTDDQWATSAMNDLATPDGSWPANPCHRYTDNDNDQNGFWCADGHVRMCTADWGTCSSGTMDAGSAAVGDYFWIGAYTHSTDRYWGLTYGKDGALNYKWRFQVSDDGITWIRQYEFSGTVRHCWGWPYDDLRFYATQSGAVAPLLISEDRGVSWTAKTGNWAALGYTGDIRCVVAVFVD